PDELLCSNEQLRAAALYKHPTETTVPGIVDVEVVAPVVEPLGEVRAFNEHAGERRRELGPRELQPDYQPQATKEKLTKESPANVVVIDRFGEALRCPHDLRPRRRQKVVDLLSARVEPCLLEVRLILPAKPLDRRLPRFLALMRVDAVVQ